jgi:hypothetical protein
MVLVLLEAVEFLLLLVEMVVVLLGGGLFHLWAVLFVLVTCSDAHHQNTSIRKRLNCKT